MKSNNGRSSTSRSQTAAIDGSGVSSDELCIGVVHTTLGTFHLAVSDHGVVECLRGGRARALRGNRGQVSAAAQAIYRQAQDALNAYADGDSAPIRRVPLDLRGTPFQQSVWRALREIPAGTVFSYHTIAQNIDRPQAVRAVGTACGANPALLFVPCHRVIRSGETAIEQRLGGFSAGLPLKRTLLRHESVLTVS